MKAAGKGGEAAQWREAGKDGNTGDNLEDCPVCLTSFDEIVQRPRTLPCGHTVCTPCMNKLKEEGHVTCPECRICHVVPAGGQFPVCYTLEAFIRRMKGAEAVASSSPPPNARKQKGAARAAGQKEATGLSKMLSFLQEQEARVVAAITTCQEVQLQLEQYQTAVTGWGEQLQQLEDRLQGLVDQSRSAKELVGQEKSRVAAKKEEVKKGEQQLHATLEALRTLTRQQEVGVVVTEVFRCTGNAEQVVQECQESFPDADTVTTVRKVREASTAALEAFQAVQPALETHPIVTEQELRPQPDSETMPQSDAETRPQSDPDSTIMDRLQVILTPSLKHPSLHPGSVQVEDLRSLTEPARSLLEAGRVFAVHLVEGQCRHARISLEAGQLYLHALKQHAPPPGATTLQVSEVVPPSPPWTVFLDLSWPGRDAPRRVHVRLAHDTPLGRQFELLCTALRGACLAGTRLFRVANKGRPGEFVCGGDYERNDGTGGAALLPRLGEGDYLSSGRAGAVWRRWGWLGVPAHGAQFGITTRDRQDGGEYRDVFGEVVHGLDAVVAAARHRRIKEVTVVDCGVVLRE